MYCRLKNQRNVRRRQFVLARNSPTFRMGNILSCPVALYCRLGSVLAAEATPALSEDPSERESEGCRPSESEDGGGDGECEPVVNERDGKVGRGGPLMLPCDTVTRGSASELRDESLAIAVASKVAPFDRWKRPAGHLLALRRTLTQTALCGEPPPASAPDLSRLRTHS